MLNASAYNTEISPVEAHGTSKSTGISSAAATVRIRSSGTDCLPYSHSCTTRSALAPV
nr:MAG TPA: hypothetical protein [Caudoviricetes sp.]DAG57914.1 MAG TPA: hypothetical protein [Caudoviricetes sp.]